MRQHTSGPPFQTSYSPHNARRIQNVSFALGSVRCKPLSRVSGNGITVLLLNGPDATASLVFRNGVADIDSLKMVRCKTFDFNVRRGFALFHFHISRKIYPRNETTRKMIVWSHNVLRVLSLYIVHRRNMISLVKRRLSSRALAKPRARPFSVFGLAARIRLCTTRPGHALGTTRTKTPSSALRW